VAVAFFINHQESETITTHQKDHNLIKYQQIIHDIHLVRSCEEQAHDHQEVEDLE